MPHEFCYLRNPAMVNLHFWSDLLIGIAYVAISVTLVYLVRKGRREIPFHWMFLAFGVFIIACGGTHFMEVWTLWTPMYWLAGMVKSVTALASVATALALPPLVPRTLGLVRSAKLSDERQTELEAANAALTREITERRRAEDEVRKLAGDLETRVRERTAELARANEELAEKAAIVQHSRDAILSWELDGTVTSWNPGGGAGVRLHAGRRRSARMCHGWFRRTRREELTGLLNRLQQGEELQPIEIAGVRKDGVLIETSMTVSPLRDAAGKIRGASVITRDITEENRSEEQLRQVQKLESLGLIAGGVAHDFNNLLVGIMGNASLALEVLPRSSPNYQLIDNAIKAAEKAAHLTQQLLAYAGKGRFVVGKAGPVADGKGNQQPG